jgi:hypothetical protein
MTLGLRSCIGNHARVTYSCIRFSISTFEELLESRCLDIGVQFFGIQRTRCFRGGNSVIASAVDTVLVLC